MTSPAFVDSIRAAAEGAPPNKGGGRGRPVGSKDRRSPLPRVGHHDDYHYTLSDRCAAKLALLQLPLANPCLGDCRIRDI